MSAKLRRRTVYAATMMMVLVLVGGFVLGAISVGSFTRQPAAQGGSTTGPLSTPVGVMHLSASLSIAGASAAASSSSLAAPFSVCSGFATCGTSAAPDTPSYFINAVAAGNYIEVITVQWDGTAVPPAPVNTEYKVVIEISGVASPPQPMTIYVVTPASAAVPPWTTGLTGSMSQVSFTVDIGSGAGGFTINSISDLVTQCAAVGGPC